MLRVQRIPRSALLDALEDDDDIEWPEDPFDRHDSDPKSPDELLAMIHARAPGCTEGPLLRVHRHLRHCGSFHSRESGRDGHRERPIEMELPQNRLPQRNHSAEKQHAIRTQVEAPLKLGVIEESRATHWSQVHPVRLTLDFVKLNATTSGLEG